MEARRDVPGSPGRLRAKRKEALMSLYLTALWLLIPFIVWPIAAHFEPCTCELYGHCARCGR